MVYLISRNEAKEKLNGGYPVWVGTSGSLLKFRMPVAPIKIGMPYDSSPFLGGYNKFTVVSPGDKIICIGMDNAICNYCRKQQGRGLVQYTPFEVKNLIPPFVLIFRDFGSWSHYCKNISGWRLDS